MPRVWTTRPDCGLSWRRCAAWSARSCPALVRRLHGAGGNRPAGRKTSAYDIDPRVAIAVDVTHATDCPTIDKRQRGEICLGKGPVIFRGPNMNPVVSERLMSIAARENIPYQLAAIGRATSNDANSLQVSRGGVATAVVAIPNRYMHSAVETVSLEDLDHAADLLAHFARDLQPSDDFTP